MREYRHVDRPPWAFRLAEWLAGRGLRGGGVVLRLADRFGWFDAIVKYHVAENVAIDVPLYRPANRWTREQLLDYERASLDLLAAALADLPGPATLVDCGADIGTFSVLAAARCPSIDRIFAVEPDAEAFEVLEANVERLVDSGRLIEGESLLSAVGDRRGRGRLVAPDYDDSAHARFIAPDEAGDAELTTVDSLGLPGGMGERNLALKIDVEGTELDVLQGAAETIRAARAAVVLFEAHRDAAMRSGVDPIECARFLSSLRSFSFRVAERPEFELSSDGSYFEQVRERITNVVAVSTIGGLPSNCFPANE